MAEMQSIIEEYFNYLGNKTFPCVAARAALRNEHIKCMVALNMACPNDDPAILKFLYDFVNEYRTATTSFHSAAIVFKGPWISSEEMFDALFWKRLQSLSNLDAVNYNYDIRVAADPASGNFSFSIKEEAFFIIGLHPLSSRQSRKFKYPALVFNPHAEFEKLRLANRYEQMKHVVRKRDIAYSGSINPMLKDFGESSEVYQYSGRIYDSEWKCPLKINHANNKNNSSA